MKRELLTLVVAAAGMMGSVSVAGAQQSPPAPSPTPPSAGTQPEAAPTPPAPPTPAVSPESPAPGGAAPGAPAPGAPAPGAPAPGSPGAAPAGAPPPGSPTQPVPWQPGPAPGGPGPGPVQPVDPTPPPPPTPPTPESNTVTPPGPDKPQDGQKPDSSTGAAQLGLGTPNPFRTSWFNWQTSATSKTLAVGDDYYGTEDESVTMDFSVTPRYSFVNTKTDWAWVGLNIPWSVELTNSDTTTKKNQTLFGDLGIQSAYNRTLLRSDNGLVVLAGPRIGVQLPTSLASQFNGTYLTSSLGAGASSNIPLLSGDWLSSVFVSGGLSWQHLFSDSTGPYAGEQVRPRQGSGAPKGPLLGDQIVEQSFMPSGRLFNSDVVAANFSYNLTVFGDFSIGNTWGIQMPFRYQPTGNGCEAYAANTGCVDVPMAEDVSNVPLTIFDVSLGYTVASLVWVSVGYNNTARQLGDNGKRQNMFYSNDGSSFYVSASVFLDAIYSRVKKAVEPEKRSEKNATAQSGVASAFGL